MKFGLIVACVAFMVSAATAAEDNKKYFSDWIVQSEGDSISEAYTANESGSTFGYVCLSEDQSCFYYLNSKTQCEVNALVPVLVNAEEGSLAVSMKCIDLKGEKYSIFQDADAISNGVKSGSMIGFAIPMASGQFKVVRFSLNGANSAKMEAINRVKSNKPRDTML